MCVLSLLRPGKCRAENTTREQVCLKRKPPCVLVGAIESRATGRVGASEDGRAGDDLVRHLRTGRIDHQGRARQRVEDHDGVCTRGRRVWYSAVSDDGNVDCGIRSRGAVIVAKVGDLPLLYVDHVVDDCNHCSERFHGFLSRATPLL